MDKIARLKADYPGLLALLGEPLFEFFARGYLHGRPSSSASLYDLGRDFPAFLLRSQRRGAGPRQRFPIELARLERQAAEAARAPGLEAAPAPAADPLSPLGGPCEIGLPATTRLLILSHPLGAYLSWPDGGGDRCEPRRDYAVIRRHRFRILRERLEDWQFFALRHAAHRPRALRDCARAAARRTGRTTGELHALLALWLPSAQAESIVTLTLDP